MLEILELSSLAAPREVGGERRIDGRLKVTGGMPYAADLFIEGTLHAAVVRSPHQHARIVSIDMRAARALSGVHCVLTGADVSDIRCGRGLRDAPILAVGKARFAGEPVAAVAAETKEIAEEAVALVTVDYEPLAAVFDVEDALRPDAPAIHDDPGAYADAAHKPGDLQNVIAHRVWNYGPGIEAALANSEIQFEHTFRTQRVHQRYIEPHCCTVLAGPGARVRVWSCNKVPYVLRENLAASFGLNPEDIEVHTAAIGGDFGGKGTPMDVPLCLELSRRTRRPVRLARTYTDELLAAAPRHGAAMTVRVGVKRDGTLQALHFRGLLNSGAYGGFRPGAAMRSPCATSYRIPSARVEVVRVYTNELPAGNMRTPAAPQMTFAIEGMFDFVARQIAMDPIDFRRINVLADGEPNLLGDIWPESRASETLEAAVRAHGRAAVPRGPNIKLGTGVAIYDRPTPVPQHTSLRLRLARDGKIEVDAPIQETGTGSHTVIQGVVAAALGLDRHQVAVRYVGTSELPYDSGIGGSKITVTATEAATMAARTLSGELRIQAAKLLGAELANVEAAPRGMWRDRRSGQELTLADMAAAGLTVEAVSEVPPTQEKEAATSFCVQLAQVGVDTETGQVFVYELVSAHDVAEILEPMSHRGQIEGGIVMGHGFALSEDLGLVEGRVSAAHLGDYKLPTMRDIPPLKVVLVPGGKGVGARNVKSIGELANVTTAAAIANAVSNALCTTIDRLPISADMVLSTIHSQEDKG